MTARTKKTTMTLSANASYEVEKDMGPATFERHCSLIAKDFLKHGYMVQVVKGRTLEDHDAQQRVFDVVDETWEPTGLKVTASVLLELIEARLIMRRWVDDTEVYLHMHHETFGFNTPSNYGLPKNIRLGQLTPGTLLKVRFTDYSQDVTCILVSRERTPESARYEVEAVVLAMLDAERFDKVNITLRQVMEVKGSVGQYL